MAKKEKGGQNGGPITPPDFEAAARIYKNDIVPANKAQKQAMAEASAGWKAVKGNRVHVKGYRDAMKTADMEEAEQQAYLRSYKRGLQDRNVTLHADAVDIMNGVNESDLEVVPSGAAPKVDLPVVN